MPKILAPGECYAGRNQDASVLNVTISRDVHDMLRQYAPGRRSMGRFISNLVLEYHVRQQATQEAREQLKAELANILS
jgi:hypothetical protein